MKTIRKATILLIIVIGMIGVAPQKATAQVSVSFQLFYDNLSPYGNWINNPNYGYVWVPDVSYGFAPYRTNGYWVYTEVGWTWVSNYSWGWAPFHYGRWFYDSYYGWVWVPDTYWGPAWVTWRYCDGYYGWAAIGPGIDINIAFSGGYNLPYNHWVFVREANFGRRNISNYYLNSSNNTVIINKSRVVNNIQRDNNLRGSYNAGPARGDVQKRSKATIAQVNLKDRDKPGQSMVRNELQLYKPRVEKGNNNDRQPAPAKVMKQHDVKSITERKAVEQSRREINKVDKQPMKQPSRQSENREREMQQPQRRQETQMRRPNEREIQRRENPVRQQRDVEKRPNVPQTRRQETPLQQRNNVEQRDMGHKSERNN